MGRLADISRQIRATAEAWAQLAVKNSWVRDAEVENAKFRRALLAVAVTVLSSDAPLNAYEFLLLRELFGSTEDVERAEVKSKMGKNIGGEAMAVLARAVQGFAFKDPNYRPDRDPVVSILNDVLDAGLAADKFPSETEAWAASRVLTKLRQIGLGEPVGPAMQSMPTLELRELVLKPPAKSSRPSLPPAVSPHFEPQPETEPETLNVAPTPKKMSSPRTTPVHSRTIQALLTELNALVGLESVKEQVETLVNLAKVRALRAERGLPSPDISFHLVFSGNPGTGKTTVARILGQIYGKLGLLSVGKCIEVDRGAFIGQYLGQTTTKTIDVLSNSLGSVLFVDEAYSLTEGEGDSNAYGNEAISVILKFMEDNRDDFVVIAAGYSDEMERFLSSNPGLRSRFSRKIEFPDYQVDELVEIFRRMCGSDGYALETGADSKLRLILAELLNPKPPHFANAREVRKIYERAIERQANRIVGSSCTDDELSLLRIEDIPREAP